MKRDAFFRDLGSAQDAARPGIIASRADAIDCTWVLWKEFCLDLYIDPWLTELGDPVHLLQVLAHRYRTGKIAPSR
jgi:hypothetical protein